MYACIGAVIKESSHCESIFEGAFFLSLHELHLIPTTDNIRSCFNVFNVKTETMSVTRMMWRIQFEGCETSIIP